jgi:hypothetical protein
MLIYTIKPFMHVIWTFVKTGKVFTGESAERWFFTTTMIVKPLLSDNYKVSPCCGSFMQHFDKLHVQEDKKYLTGILILQ